MATIASHMAGFAEHWSLCGGWAVDAWLGKQTREHGDIDVSVFADDQRAPFDHLRGWQFLAHNPAWEPGRGDQGWDGDRVLPPATHIHARPPEFSGPMPKDGLANAEDGFTIEFYLDDVADDEWILSRDPRITVPLADGLRPSAWGVAVPSPEVLLSFKARGPVIRRRDWGDFRSLLPLLGDTQLAWVRDAIAQLGHPWTGELAPKGGAA